MSNFITNHETRDLKKRLIELIQKSQELKFLVGFFYFSGIRELYNGLKSKPDTIIKVLVGLNVDFLNFELVETAQNNQPSFEEKTDRFLESIKKSLNTEKFDNKEFYEQVKFFIELIEKDKLIIRKTKEPNHAKLYLFKLEQDQVGRKNLFITGSSNLTKSGISLQNEFNVEISDYGFENAEKYFDENWESAVPITEYADIKKKLLETIEKETLIKEISPFEAFYLVLKTYLDSFKQKEISGSLVKILEKNGYIPYRYQLDAVKQALATIESDNGVIIADVVGLGKTIIACSIAQQLRKRGLIICPPGLKGDKNKNFGWEKYTEQFGLYDWEVRSVGDLENTLNFINKTTDIEVIIIDEAHRFRNQDTKTYELLKNICRGRKVILLTATPFNNHPNDIFSLLKLFITPKKSSITLESNLVDQFKRFSSKFEKIGYIKKHWDSQAEDKKKSACNKYNELFKEEKTIITKNELKKIKQKAQTLAKKIKNVIEPVTIRRNRLDLENLYSDEVKNLSRIADPIEWFFELSKEQLDFYSQIIEYYFGGPTNGGQFKGAIYKPFEYEKEINISSEKKLSEEDNRLLQQQRNLFDFMRRLIVKRFESSFGAFKQTIKNFKEITQDIQKFIEKTDEYILDRSLLEKIYDSDIDEIEKNLLEYEEKIRNGVYPKHHKRYKIKKFKFKDKFLSDIQSDLNLFDEILDTLSRLNLIENDPKSDCLIQNIKRELSKTPINNEPKRKIIIFSEYVDTVKYLDNYLKKELEEHFHKRILTIDGDLSNSKIELINQNFDASYSDQKDDFDILLSSDKISEGFNLNRSGLIINYDIPWNPVRVIQRVGRINRIGNKVFDELFIVNFFPTEKGADIVQSRKIAQNKMFLIHNTLGEDSKIFDIDEEPSASGLYHKLQESPEKQEKISFYTKVFNEFQAIKKEHPELIENLKNCPPRIKVAKKYSKNELLVFYKKEDRLYVISNHYDKENNSKSYSTSFEDTFDEIKCSFDEPTLPLSDSFWLTYENAKKFKDYRVQGLNNDQNIEQQAVNTLITLLSLQNQELLPYRGFLKILLEDINDYGTLPTTTLRRIANIELSENNKNRYSENEGEETKNTAITTIAEIRQELGENYLLKEKTQQKAFSKEIIIAIENQKL